MNKNHQNEIIKNIFLANNWGSSTSHQTQIGSESEVFKTQQETIALKLRSVFSRCHLRLVRSYVRNPNVT